jgi:hypothetical protein
VRSENILRPHQKSRKTWWVTSKPKRVPVVAEWSGRSQAIQHGLKTELFQQLPTRFMQKYSTQWIRSVYLMNCQPPIAPALLQLYRFSLVPVAQLLCALPSPQVERNIVISKPIQTQDRCLHLSPSMCYRCCRCCRCYWCCKGGKLQGGKEDLTWLPCFF